MKQKPSFADYMLFYFQNETAVKTFLSIIQRKIDQNMAKVKE